MTQNNTINVALQTVGVFLLGVVATTFSTNPWLALACAVVGIGFLTAYELLP